MRLKNLKPIRCKCKSHQIMKDFNGGDRCGISYYWQAAAVWVGGMRNITVRWRDGEMLRWWDDKMVR